MIRNRGQLGIILGSLEFSRNKAELQVKIVFSEFLHAYGIVKRSFNSEEL